MASQSSKREWINLNDESGVKLLGGKFKGRTIVILQGVRPRSPLYYRILRGDVRRKQDRVGLDFKPSPLGAYLIHACAPNEPIFLSQFTPLWPKAAYEKMDRKDFFLELEAMANRAERKTTEDGNAAQGDASEDIADILNQSIYLGRNNQGHRVFEGVSGRLYVTNEDALVREGEGAAGYMFLRAENERDLRACARGIIVSCDVGDAQKIEDLLRFSGAVLKKEPEDLTQEDRELIARALDSALLEVLTAHDSAHSASVDAQYYQEMMPGRAALAVDSATSPFVPAPLAVQVQRFLCASRTIRVEGKIPPFGFGLLSDSTNVFVSGADASAWEAEESIRPTWANVGEGNIAIGDCEAGYLRISRAMPAERIERFFGNVMPEGICVVTAGSISELERVGAHMNFDRVIQVPPWLSVTQFPILLAVGQANPREIQAERPRPVDVASWDELKIVFDEVIRLQGREAEMAQAAKSNKDARPVGENKLQRPYIAHSRVTPSFTMVPKNLQAPISAALSRVEEINGPIDHFFSEEIGISVDALAERFSSEQIDAAALIFHRMRQGKGFILGDETGVGKGRTIAATVVWALRQNRPVVFVTDKSTLFSDLARDLIDIGEWNRVRPLITNSDGDILNIMGDGEVLAKATSPVEMAHYLNGSRQHNANIIFTTYSQINGEDSVKAAWLAEQAQGALLIADEAHIAAGSDSNIAANLNMLTDSAWGVLFSSATWAKSSRNLQIFKPALPDSVNLAQVADAMKSSDGAFGEVFSSMLAADGAFIRREHDLSKIDFVLDIDDAHRERNEQVQEQVSEILGMMSVISGDIDHLVQRANGPTRAAIHKARTAHAAITRAQLLNRRATAPATDAVAQAQGEQDDPDQNQGALDAADEPKGPMKLFSSSFGTGGAIYTVMRRCMAALAVDHAVDLAVKDAKDGRRSVLVLSETGETFVRAAIQEEMQRVREEIARTQTRAEAGEIAEDSVEAQHARDIGRMLDARANVADVLQSIRVPTLQDMMRTLVRRLGGLKVLEAKKEGDEEQGITGDEQFSVTLSIGLKDLPGITEKDIEQYKEGIDAINAKIDALPPISISPMDELRTKLAEKGLQVGEISGRTFELHPQADENGQPSGLAKLIKRARKKSDITRMVQKFNAGDQGVDVLVINRSAATGLSMHASERFKNRDQRHLIELQQEENPTDRIQLFGRVNRAGQVVPPLISITTSGLKSELRSIMMQNKKLTDLSANIRSSRENAAVIADVPDLLNAMGDRVCQEYLLENPGIASRLELSNERLRVAGGLANFLTQRMVLLSKDNQETIYKDLSIAYADAKLESELTDSANTTRLRDWRARTVQQSHAWGPQTNLHAISAFDGPVQARVVSYEYDYKPLQWDDLRQRVAQSTQRLAGDDRVRAALARTLVRPEDGSVMFTSVLEEEKAQPAHIKRSLWARDMLQFMVQYLPAEETAGDAQAGLDLDLDFDAVEVSEADAKSLFEKRLQAATQSRIDFSSLPRRNNMGSLAGHWIGAQARMMGSEMERRFMVLVSRSGKTAKLWSPDFERGTAMVYLLDFEKGFSTSENNPYKAFKRLGDVVIKEDSWVRDRFNKTWGSYDPDVSLLDISDAAQAGANVLEAQKLLTLPTSGFSSIEQALSASEDNAIKEAHKRALFLRDVISKLAPGQGVYMVRPHERGLSTLSDHFAGKPLLLVDVQVPDVGEESLLSHWKFHFATPGNEKIIALSGALLLKLAGPAPLFSRMSLTHNVFSRPLADVQRIYNRFVPRLQTRAKTLLVGNAYQSTQWARESKMGTPILYTDENGATHRAVELESNAFGLMQIDRFPIRLYHRDAVTKFAMALIDQATQTGTGASVFTSIKGALPFDSLNPSGVAPDRITFTAEGLHWSIPKDEKERIRRTLRIAVAQDKGKWLKEHPDRNPEEYPVVFSTKSSKTSSVANQVPLIIKLPENEEGRLRFFTLLIESQGLQLIVPALSRLKDKAREVEAWFYDSQTQAQADALEQQKAEAAKRAHYRELMGQAAPMVVSIAGQPTEHGEQLRASSPEADALEGLDADAPEVETSDAPGASMAMRGAA